jgi:hypothetical protein
MITIIDKNLNQGYWCPFWAVKNRIIAGAVLTARN